MLVTNTLEMPVYIGYTFIGIYLTTLLCASLVMLRLEQIRCSWFLKYYLTIS